MTILFVFADWMTVPQLWILVPISSRTFRSNCWRNDLKSASDNGSLVNGLDDSYESRKTEAIEEDDTWLMWNEFRSHLSCDKRIGVVLELSGDLPDMEMMQRWEGEPVKAVMLPTSMFLTNKKGYPVLSKAHQLFLKSLMFKYLAFSFIF